MVQVSMVNGVSPQFYPQDINYDSDGKNVKSVVEDISDSVEISSKTDASCDGKFTWKEASKNFIKGVFSPLTALIKHPLITLGTLAVAGLACFAVPVLTPILTVGFGAMSVYQLGKATVDTVKNYKNGNYDEAEKGFENIGTGFISTVMTVLGLKQAAKIAAEAKAAAKAGSAGLTASQKSQIAEQIAKGGIKNSLKEIFSLVTTKEGRAATIAQFKPSAIKQRFTAFKKAINNIKKPKTQEEQIAEFKKSPEGIRRAGLTEEQLQAEAQAKFNHAFDELDIPKEQRPVLKFEKNTVNHAGSYSKNSHAIEINPESYKSGIVELDNVIMHEATHCKEAILRASIPQEKANQIIADELAGRIINGESEKILLKGDILGAETIEPPKLTGGLKKDFAEFARAELYTKNNNLTENLNTVISEARLKMDASKYYDEQCLHNAEKAINSTISKLKTMLDKNPEFVKNYNSYDEALYALEQYSLSHKVRYDYFSNVSIKGVKPTALSPEMLAAAEQSLKNDIATIEGNARMSGIGGMFADTKDFNQYQFSPEEVLAEQNGNNFVIKNVKAQMASMKSNGTLTPEKEAYFTSLIQKAEATIAYKTKGLEYYKLYTKMINNPNNEELAVQVENLGKELAKLKGVLPPEEIAKIEETIKMTYAIPANITVILSQIK